MKIQEPEMAFVQGGVFLMGSDNGADDEKPVHEVCLTSFSIAVRTVTNSEYDAFMKANTLVPEPEWIGDPHFSDEKQPIVGVSWFDAVAYCEWLSQHTGRQYRLPTEAEWEFAACGGSPQNVYPWGTRNWEQRSELHSRFKSGPELVASFEPNSLGIFDMGLNVHEWCSDWYGRNYYAISPFQDPKGPEEGTRRASRGGSWRHAVKISRCAARSSIPPQMRYADYGFRVVMTT